MNKKLIRLLSLAMIAVMALSLCACSAGTVEEEATTITYKSEVPEGKQEVVERFNKLMADTKNAKGFDEMKYSLGNDISGVDSENATLKNLIKLYADESASAAAGQEGLSTKDPEKKVTAKECFPVMGSDEAAVLDFADVRSAVITDNEADAYYTIVIKLNPEKNPNQEDSIYGKLYKITKDEDILKAFDGFKDFFTVGSYDANYGVGTIRMQVDKKSDRVMKVELIREVAIETTVTGQGAMKDEIGKDIPATFNYSSTATYEVLWKDIPVE